MDSRLDLGRKKQFDPQERLNAIHAAKPVRHAPLWHRVRRLQGSRPPAQLKLRTRARRALGGTPRRLV